MGSSATPLEALSFFQKNRCRRTTEENQSRKHESVFAFPSSTFWDASAFVLGKMLGKTEWVWFPLYKRPPAYSVLI